MVPREYPENFKGDRSKTVGDPKCPFLGDHDSNSCTYFDNLYFQDAKLKNFG